MRGRSDRCPADHARRIDRVRPPRRPTHERRGPGVPSGELRGAHETGYGRLAGSESAVVTTSTSCPRSARKSASAGAWLAGPPGSGGQIPETTTTLTLQRDLGGRYLVAQTRNHDQPRCCEHERREEDSHGGTGRTPLDAQYSHQRDRTRVSSPCVTMRSRGRPIVTGSDFVQPRTKWIAAATSTIRAASVAPA